MVQACTVRVQLIFKPDSLQTFGTLNLLAYHDLQLPPNVCRRDEARQGIQTGPYKMLGGQWSLVLHRESRVHIRV